MPETLIRKVSGISAVLQLTAFKFKPFEVHFNLIRYNFIFTDVFIFKLIKKYSHDVNILFENFNTILKKYSFMAAIMKRMITLILHINNEVTVGLHAE